MNDLMDCMADVDCETPRQEPVSFAEALTAGVEEPTLIMACSCSGRAGLLELLPDDDGPALSWRDRSMVHLWLSREQAARVLDQLFPQRGMAAQLTSPPPGEFWSVAVFQGVVRFERARPDLRDPLRWFQVTAPVFVEWSPCRA